MINQVIIPILYLFANVVTTVVIVQFVLSLLLSFNVVSLQTPLISALWQALNAILEPLLGPIRRRMPNTGAIDFSPIALLLGIQILIMILSYIGNQLA